MSIITQEKVFNELFNLLDEYHLLSRDLLNDLSDLVNKEIPERINIKEERSSR